MDWPVAFTVNGAAFTVSVPGLNLADRVVVGRSQIPLGDCIITDVLNNVAVVAREPLNVALGSLLTRPV